MKISCKDFANGEKIPQKYTCEGENRNPALLIEDPPQGTKSFALIVDDPDAPGGTWTHWTLWNIPSSRREIPEGIAGLGIVGITSARTEGYHGPCPPPGKPHRYFFKLYALDCLLSLKQGSPRVSLENDMKGHVLAQADLMGTYQR